MIDPGMNTNKGHFVTNSSSAVSLGAGDKQYQNAMDFLRNQLHEIDFAVDEPDDQY